MKAFLATAIDSWFPWSNRPHLRPISYEHLSGWIFPVLESCNSFLSLLTKPTWWSPSCWFGSFMKNSWVSLKVWCPFMHASCPCSLWCAHMWRTQLSSRRGELGTGLLTWRDQHRADWVNVEMTQSLGLASEERWSKSQQSLFHSRQRASKVGGRRFQVVLLSSQVSSDPRSKSDVEHSESRRQADSRRKMCAWGNRALAPKQNFRGRLPVPRKGLAYKAK